MKPEQLEKYRGRVCFPMYAHHITQEQYEDIEQWSFDFITEHPKMGREAEQKILMWLDQAVRCRVERQEKDD